MKITLTEHQKPIFDNIVADVDEIITNRYADNVISLTGPAGVGKTVMTVQLIKELSAEYKLAMTTPTHKALNVAREMLKNEDIEIPCSTIHSFLNLKLKPNYNSGLQELIADTFSKNKERIDILLVDESSMVSDELFEHIFTAVDQGRAKCVIFIGDKYQLPPVEGDQNPVFSHIEIDQYELTEIVRQAKDNPIINLATDIRERIESKEFISLDKLIDKYECKEIAIYETKKDFMNEFYNSATAPWYLKDQVIAAYTNDAIDHYNKTIRDQYWKSKGIEEVEFLRKEDMVVFQDAHIVDDTVVHTNNEVVEIQEAEKEFATDLDCWYWNCVDTEGLEFKVIDPESAADFKRILNKISQAANQAVGYEKKTLWQSFYRLKARFQNIKYTFASTTHKLQGSTYDHCYIDLQEMKRFYDYQGGEFIYRLLYVAVTRAAKDIKILA